jgi:hypothetical protein
LKSEILCYFYQNKINFERYSQASRTSQSISKRFRAKGIVDKKCFDAIKKSQDTYFEFQF